MMNQLAEKQQEANEPLGDPKYLIPEALAILMRAAEIRRDVALMAQVREYVRAEKDRLMGLLDEI